MFSVVTTVSVVAVPTGTGSVVATGNVVPAGTPGRKAFMIDVS